MAVRWKLGPPAPSFQCFTYILLDRLCCDCRFTRIYSVTHPFFGIALYAGQSTSLEQSNLIVNSSPVSQIGLDVLEKHRQLKSSILSFARRYFAPSEVEFLSSFTDPEAQRREFLKLWALKVRSHQPSSSKSASSIPPCGKVNHLIR